MLQKAVENGAKQIGLKRIPQVLINKKGNEIYVMGSFRRWYIVCSLEQAELLENQLTDSPSTTMTVHAKIFHELYHFKTGDYWQLGYLAELLQTTFYLTLWVLTLFAGWIIFLLLAKTAILQLSPSFLLRNVPAEIQPILAQLLGMILPPRAQLEVMNQRAAEMNFFCSSLVCFESFVPHNILCRYFMVLLPSSVMADERVLCRRWHGAKFRNDSPLLDYDLCQSCLLAK